MGNSEEGKSCKSEKPSSPAPQDMTTQVNPANIHVHPDWAAMQAYYGPRVALPPYYNTSMASGHAPHPYMWGPPQPMLPPYGSPYAAIYSHGGVYAHPSVSLGSQSHGHGPHGVPSSPAIAATPLSIETPTKSSGNTDQGLIKKLKGFDGLTMSIGNGGAESMEGGEEHSQSHSGETEGASDGSVGNTSGDNQTKGKRSCEGTLSTDGKTKTPTKEAKAACNMVLGMAIASTGMNGKLVTPVVSPGMSTALELRNPTSINPKASPSSGPQPCSALPPETLVQNERELKRERRKQSNRESARRSRLRKQAETEELARKVESLTAENIAIKSEINRLAENSEKLKQENAKLVGKLKHTELDGSEMVLEGINSKRVQPISTENLLSKVDNVVHINSSSEEEDGLYKTNPNSSAKLHQLLGTSPRADAVAAV